MRMTPLDIQQQQFTVRFFRGFDRQEVEAFLEDLAEDYESIAKENTLLKEQLESLEQRARGVEDREKLLQETLVTTHKLAEEWKENSRREAELVVREAQMAGEKLLEEARTEEARIRTDVQALKRVRRQLIEELRATVETYQRLLTSDMPPQGDGESKG